MEKNVKKILIVDDSQAIAHRLKGLIEEQGYIITDTVATGHDAIKSVKKTKPDLILMDIVLRGPIDGIETASEIHRNYNLPIIYITSNNDIKNLERAKETMPYGYIIKPVKEYELYSTIHTALYKHETEKTLKQSEEKFRLISVAAHEAIVILNSSEEVTFWNPAAEKIFGYNSDEILGKSIFQVITPPELRKDYQEYFSQWKSSENEKTKETTFKLKAIKKDGSRILIESSSSQVYIQNQWNSLSIIRDVTERIRLEEKLRENEERYRYLLESIQTGIMVIETENHTIIDVNPAMEKLLGLQKKQITGKQYSSFFSNIHPLHSLDDLSYTNHCETQIIRSKDNIIIDILKTIVPATINNKKVLIVSFVDITQQKQTETQLIKANREIHNLLSSIDSILIGVSGKDIITHWNRMAEIELEIPASAAIGMNFKELNINWDWEEIYIGIAECMSTFNATILDDISLTDKSQKQHILGITINPVVDIEQGITGFLIYGRNITDRRIMEMQLLQDQKLKSIGELAAGIAHEINTPTQYVINNTVFFKDTFKDILQILEVLTKNKDLLNKCSKSNDQENNLLKIIENIDINYVIDEVPAAINQSLEGLARIASIVTSMKSFSHPGVDKKMFMDINKSLTDTITITKNEWKYHAEVITELDNTLPEIYCYPAELNQVFLNILVNAAHATKEAVEKGLTQTGTITITTRKDKNDALISIKDNGTGIDEEIKDRIFDPFFTTKEVGKGTGQGLAIAHSIITHKHGGSITVETRKGKGAEFIIRIPIRNEEV